MTSPSQLPFADDRILLNLASYWAAKRGLPLPQRRDIDPLDMPRSLLPHLALVEPVEGGPVVRFRLIGTELVQRYGRDATGKTSADIWQGPIAGIWNSFTPWSLPTAGRSTPKARRHGRKRA